MKRHLYLLLLTLFATLGAKAQMFTPEPNPLQNGSKNVVITFHDSKSDSKSQGKLMTLTTDLYAHIGVYTTASPSEWKNAPKWGTNTDKYKFKYISSNTWKLTIGDLRQYFNITDPNERITKICVIARNAASSIQTSDNFIDVFEDGFSANLTNDAEATVLTAAKTINFTLTSTEAATLKIVIAKDGTQVSAKDASNARSLSLSYNFASKGAYTITATANNGSETITKTANVLFMSASPAGQYPGGVPKMGAVAQSNGDVIFCLAAPGKSSVLLVPSWDNYEPLDKNVMAYQDYNGQRYFWVKISGLDPNKQYPYYYVVDGNINVGDPYAHLVLDPYSDKWLPENIWPNRPLYPYDKIDNIVLAVYHGNQDNYNWKVKNFDIPDPSKLIIYEMLFRDFTGDESDQNGKQFGTIRSAIDKFDYFLELGVNAIELMPVMEFNGNNSWGYNTNFYMALDKAYGSPDDLKEFIDLCHQHNIAVLLDIVFNQSDGLHPWYQMYDIASNPFYNKTAPHNWSVLNDWKQENALVQQQWKDAIAYWMTKYKVDGFRFDLVKGLGSGATSSAYGSTDGYNAKRIENMKKIHTYITDINPKGIHINEFLGDSNEEIEYGKDGQYNWANQSWLSQVYAAGLPNKAQGLRYYSTSACKRYGRSNIAYAESHDEERLGFAQTSSKMKWDNLTSKMTNASLKDRMSRLGAVAVHLLITKDATPMIWMFGELGADQTTKDASGGNDTGAKKVVWNYYDDPSRKALFNTYSAMIGMRRANPELFSDDAAQYTYSSTATNLTAGYWIRIKNGAKDVVAFINPSPTAANKVTLRADMTSDYKLLTASEGFNPTIPAGTGTRNIEIPANGYAVFQSPSVADTNDIYSDGTASDINIIGGEGCVIVQGSYNNLRIYDLEGRSYNNSDLRQGVYIVNVDGTTAKVMVR